MSALCKAIEQRRFRQVKLLLELGADINSQDESSGKTPLVAACLLEKEALACQLSRCLLKNGADVKRKDREGMTALMHACRMSKEKLTKELLKTGECDLHTTDNNGNTALMHSIMTGNVAVVKTVTESLNRYQLRGVDIPNNTGETPLIKAAQLGRTECKQILLTHGKASPNARDLRLKLTANEWQELISSAEKQTEHGHMPAPVQRRLRDNHVGDQRSRKTKRSIASRTRDDGLARKTDDHTYNIDDDADVMADIMKFETIVLQSQKRRVKSRKDDLLEQRHKVRGTNGCGTKRASRETFVPEHKKEHNSKTKFNKGRNAKARGQDTRNLSTKYLPDLLNVWVHQNTPSFRPSVRNLPPESEAELKEKMDFTVQKPKRNSLQPERSVSVAGQRFSKAARAAIAWRRFSSIYSRADFTLKGGEGGTQHAGRLSFPTATNTRTNVGTSRKARRLSVQDAVFPERSNSHRQTKPPARKHSEVHPAKIQFVGRNGMVLQNSDMVERVTLQEDQEPHAED